MFSLVKYSSLPGNWLLAVTLLICITQGYGQVYRPDAHLLFEDSSARLKLGYLHYPRLAETPSKWENKTYARQGIVKTLVLREKNGRRDTVAINRFNKKGLVLEKDSFYLYDTVTYHQKLSYTYLPEENKVKEIKRYRSTRSDTSFSYEYESLFCYDQHHFLVRNEFINHVNHDTSIVLFENDSLGILKGDKIYKPGEGLNSEFRYHYTYDEKGRIKYVVYSRSTKNKRFLRFKKKFHYGRQDSLYMEHEYLRFVYDDKAHSVKYYRNDRCSGTDYFLKASHTFQDHCCPEKDDLGVLWRKVVIVPDKKGRMQTKRTTLMVEKELCEEKEYRSELETYKYNKSGLLSEISSSEEKLYFYYFKK